MSRDDWVGRDGKLGRYIEEESERTLRSYREQPNLVAEHVNIEEDTAGGGYANRQLFELIQNSADALSPDSGVGAVAGPSAANDGGRIAVRLTDEHLYCADDGAPIDPDGVRALMFSRLSPKRGTNQIGTFGLGFKCVLGISPAPEFFSRSGSFRFDAERSCERIQESVPQAESCPALRLPEPIDPAVEREHDDVLREFMDWATNIVRLPLKPGAHRNLHKQIESFPAEFLLFVEHVRTLTLTAIQPGIDQVLTLSRGEGEAEDECLLSKGETTSRWRCFEHMHSLSPDAFADRRLGDERKEVPISWAVPIERLTEPGKFWAFFPTHTSSLLAGILNAPWKTNEDRQNLLSGPYNDNLIDASAKFIAKALPSLATHDDPARHLDALPRRHEPGDSDQADQLRKHLFAILHYRAILPDQQGHLRKLDDIFYPPRELTSTGQLDMAPFKRWEQYPNRPLHWLHHTAIGRTRFAAIDRLFQPLEGVQKIQPSAAPRATVARWLESLLEGKVQDELMEASKAAVEAAALIPDEIRDRTKLGKITLTVAETLEEPVAECLFLPDEAADSVTDPKCVVHPELASDPETFSALKELGLEPPSPESSFRLAAERVFRIPAGLDPNAQSVNFTFGPATAPSAHERHADLHQRFWELSRRLLVDSAYEVIRQQRDGCGLAKAPRVLHLRTRTGDWRALCSVLLPGRIVTGDEDLDDGVTVDLQFHEPHRELMEKLGVTDKPRERCYLSAEPWFQRFLENCRRKFKQRSEGDPRSKWLKFDAPSRGYGPLEVLHRLSDEGAARYTEALLSHDAIYAPWTMRHATQSRYPPLDCESPHIRILREHGRIRTGNGRIVPFKWALGAYPKCTDALHALLEHSKADRIKEVFRLADPAPEFFGEEDPIPLTDVWPGLNRHLREHHRACRLIRCERIHVVGEDKACIALASDVYLASPEDDDGRNALQLVSQELGLGLSRAGIKDVLRFKRPEEVENARDAVKRCSTDAERLLEAVGEKALRDALPGSLLAVLESEHSTLSGTEIAEAIIATWHTDALRRHKASLDRLDPPSKWAGSARAVRFVRSLGFSDAWAGERERKRDPYVEVEGPYSLPKLHEYQRLIADNIRTLLRGEWGEGAERRGMISMPTGSGKTRVAVQAIVEAMREDGFRGGVLWVADRDELCEQAVEAWRQVWSSKGASAARLRISRMWASQPEPVPANELHVVVATIQTLYAKLSKQREKYAFLADFNLVVFDEAHRSITRTSTSVMEEIGLTRFQRLDEPFLLGLTATPYRGHDEAETTRLVRRYGSLRLDAGAFASDEPEAVIRELQDMKVLAHADHATIEGETFSPETLSADDLQQILEELKQALERPWLPQSVENRIAQSAERTQRIIEAYEEHVEPDWPTLIFATSVKHAQTMAALLNRKGIPSRAVSGSTQAATRRRVVEEFRSGKVRALVNYGVFREGFDAPKTRAVIVARPVYSPNLYFQMIGRGLRGPKNGGDDRCLILNVRDNIQSYDRALAFSQLDWLWA